jgi:hypothetical protein
MREVQYRCQATELPNYTQPLSWWDVRQYLEDLSSGNIGLRKLFRGARFALLRAIIHLGIGYRAIVATYNWYQRKRGGNSFPWVTGSLTKTPQLNLNLQPGEWVKVRAYDDVLKTLDTSNKNRGLGFDTGEMRMHCGNTYMVERSVDHIINDRTGKMLYFGNRCVVLKDVFCSGETTEIRMFCPRAISPYWREIWLERTVPPPGNTEN